MPSKTPRSLSRDVEQVVDEVVHDVRRGAKRLRAEAGEVAGRTAVAINRSAKAIAAEAKDRGEVLADTASQAIKARPMTAVAVVAGAAAITGFLIGRLLRRDD